MVHWIAWGTSALVCRLLHTINGKYHKRYIENGFEHYLMNAYLLVLVTIVKLFINPSFSFNMSLVTFGVTNAVYPYWINKAQEMLPESSYPTLITHSDPILLTIISPVIMGSDNKLSILFPIYCMTIGKLLIIHYDNPYMRIAVDEESLQEELQQPMLHDKVLTHKQIGFSSLSLGCIVIKDIVLVKMAIAQTSISDIIFMHQIIAFLLSLVYKYEKKTKNNIVYYDSIGNTQTYIVSTISLLNNGLLNYFYIASLYRCYVDIPNPGYAKMFVGFYIPALWCYKLGISERECNEYYIGGYYCYFLALFGLVYFGR